MQLVKNNTLFLLSIFKQCYNKHSNAELWGDVLVCNFINKFGELDTGYSDSLSDFYKNISIKEVSSHGSLEVLKNWQLGQVPKTRFWRLH